MVPCERSFVAVAHTHTPHRTARPPTAPPRRERDEEMGQQRRSLKTYGRVQLCVTLPGVSHFPGQPRPFEAGGCDDYPVRLPLLPQRRPPIPPSSFPPRILRPRQAVRRWASAPHAPAPFCPAYTPRPDTHIQDKPGVLLSKEKKNGKEETSGGDSPPMQHPRKGLPSPKLCLSITPKPAAARGALGAACRTAVARG